ncbi:hypothetical protein GBAR_LOCUS20320 [Geodia barretti]|uniref:Uncharacterized protein n=1 Tax=Geodia barretti TaxID=519541 RepID=A0AA35X199_GEOBA|nr:hypothetical protein GBAR_LOCUS20320 [Geodia barretti]
MTVIWERYRKIKTGGQLKEDIKKKALQRQIKKFRTMVARDEL